MTDDIVSRDSFSSMEQIKQLAEAAMQVLMKHNHKTIYFDNCPECQLKRMLAKIQEKASTG